MSNKSAVKILSVFKFEKRPQNQPHFSLLKRINTYASGDARELGDLYEK